MKIMKINAYRSWGSTGQIITNIENYLVNHGHTTVVCYRTGNNINKNDYKVANRYFVALNKRLGYFFGIPYGFSIISTFKIISIINKERPDVIHLHSLNGNYVNIYILLKFIGKNEIPVIVTNHSEYLYTGNCTHSHDCNRWQSGCGQCDRYKKYGLSLLWDSTKMNWQSMKKAFSFNKYCTVVSVSDWVKKRSMTSPIVNSKRQVTILNGIDCENVFHLIDSIDSNDLKKKLDIENKKVILHVTVNFNDDVEHIKGGYYVINLAKKFAEDKNVVFVVISANQSNLAILPPNIINVGYVEEKAELAKYYNMADLLLMTSKRETFSMPTAEAHACGLPVVGFRAGGPETIAIEEYSEFVEYGNEDELFKTINKFLYSLNIDKRKIALAAKEKFDNTVMCAAYEKEFEMLMAAKQRVQNENNKR